MLEAIFIAQSYYPKKIQVWYIYLLECLILMVNVFFVIIPYIDAMNFCSLKSRFQVAKKKQHAVRLQLNHLEWKELPSRIAETKSSK